MVKIEQFQIHINNLNVYKHAVVENLLSSSHRDQVVKYKSKILIKSLDELQWIFKSQSKWVLAVQEGEWISKIWDHVSCSGDVREESIEA